MNGKVLVLLCGLILTTLFGAAAANAQGPLTGLPSKEGPHVAKISALGDNQWLNLGAPAADPTWGKARGSSWGAKAMMLAPDLRGGFLFGEGVHGFVKPDGHIMDDLWFYDLNAHRWICLYPGTDTKTFTQRVKDKDLKIDKNGLLVDKEGQAIPVHTSIHAWSYLAYDADRKKFAFLAGDGLGDYFLGGLKEMKEGLDLLTIQKKETKPPVWSPWYFDVASAKFERKPATGSPGGAANTFAQVHDLPSEKRFLVVGAEGIATFDPAESRWSELKPTGATPTGYDRAGCYDSKRSRIYRTEGDANLFAYDIKSNAWIDLKPKGQAPGSVGTHGAFYEYDAAADRVIAIDFIGKAPGIFAYNPQDNSWEAPFPFPADGPKFSFAANTFYDRALNAFFCHNAGDSGDNGVIWVYRYKKHG